MKEDIQDEAGEARVNSRLSAVSKACSGASRPLNVGRVFRNGAQGSTSSAIFPLGDEISVTVQVSAPARATALIKNIALLRLTVPGFMRRIGLG